MKCCEYGPRIIFLTLHLKKLMKITNKNKVFNYTKLTRLGRMNLMMPIQKFAENNVLQIQPQGLKSFSL
jgi:hypothetical protein